MKHTNHRLVERLLLWSGQNEVGQVVPLDLF